MTRPTRYPTTIRQAPGRAAAATATATPRSTTAAAPRAGTKAAPRAGSKAAPRAGTKAAPRAGSKAAPRAGTKAASRTATKAALRAAVTAAAGGAVRSAGRSATAERTATRRAAVPKPRGSGTRVAGSTALASRPAPPSRPPAPPLSVVVAADAGSPRTPFVVLVFALVGAGLVGLLLLNTAVNENAFRLHNLDMQQKTLDMQEQQLRADLDKRAFPGDLNASASRLGLVPAGPQGFIYLPSGRVVGDPKPAKARGPQVPTTPPSAPAEKRPSTPPAAGAKGSAGEPAAPAGTPGSPAGEQEQPR